MDDYQKFIATSRYSRWLEDKQRRETWGEAVDRFVDYAEDYCVPYRTEENLPLFEELFERAHISIESLEVMPSMRALMSAGEAHRRCNVAGYNCAYLAIDDLRAFDETMYILMCGTGVGFSVEVENTSKLPTIAKHLFEVEHIIQVADSKRGWASAFRELLELLRDGCIPEIDYSLVRPAGAKLRTFGGRASGPEPLKDLFEFTVALFKEAAGRQLTTLECHDLVCKIAEIVVVGGVRRSALISLSDLDDKDMAECKSGEWWVTHPHRALANNSAVYTETPSAGRFLKEWGRLYESKSGERGIFNRAAVVKQVEANGRRKSEGIDFGTNPCSEIILRPNQFCNLTEVVVRPNDVLEDLKGKVDVAVFLGTIQACWTDFKYLRPIWKENCDEERLLGVSLTGIYDGFVPSLYMNDLKEYAIERNKIYAKLFGINQAVAITCVKPSGTVSQLVDSASGMHPRYAPFYKRTVRADNKDPMTEFLKDQGVENEPCVMKPETTTIFTFYKKSPNGVMTGDRLSATQHLYKWGLLQAYWCEHKPSVTVSVREEEWLEVGAEVFNGFDTMTGVSFLPYDDHTYQQAPYQRITEEEYNNAPIYDIDWSLFSLFEKEDTTTGNQTLACTGNFCELVDIT